METEDWRYSVYSQIVNYGARQDDQGDQGYTGSAGGLLREISYRTSFQYIPIDWAHHVSLNQGVIDRSTLKEDTFRSNVKCSIFGFLLGYWQSFKSENPLVA